MKKYISYLLMLALILPVFSCTEKEKTPPVAKMKGVYHAEADGAGEVVEIFPGKSKVIDVRAYADKENPQVSDIVLTMTLKANPLAVDDYNAAHGTSYEMCPGSAFEFTKNQVMMPRYGQASTSGQVKVSTSGMEDGVTYLLPLTIGEVTETDNWALSENPEAFILLTMEHVAPDAGTGQKGDPFNLYTKEDVLKMNEKLESGKLVYFKLKNDIDMEKSRWLPLNFAEPYDKQIDFNGDGHTISNFSCDAAEYPSFFGVLYGNCYNVTFKDAEILSETAKACGVIGGYLGTKVGDKIVAGECHNVHVEGTVKCTANVRGVGGLFGRVHYGKVTDSSFKGEVTQEGGATGTGGICGWLNGTIERCSVDAVVTSNANYTGGIIGYENTQADNSPTIIRDCYTAGEIHCSQRVGGIAGGLIKEKTEVRNCYSTMKILGSCCLGGIAGHCNLDKGSGVLPNTTEAQILVDKCIAWNDAITASYDDDAEHYSSGAITAYTSTKSYLQGCYRKADLDFTECSTGTANVLHDQPDASPASPLGKADGTNTYCFPYHGVAAPASVTLSSLAKSMGWSEQVWDFSGPKPVLISQAVTPDEGDDASAGGQLPDFPENDFYR